MNAAFPFRIDGRGRAAVAGEERHIRDLIEQVLFTSPGERVMRPTFGSGLLQMVFAPLSGAVAATVQATTQAALQQWLGDRILVESVAAEAGDGTLRVEVRYRLLATGQSRVESFARQA